MITRYTPPYRTAIPPQWRGACAAVAGGGPNRATAVVVARLVFTISGPSRAFTALRLIDLVTASHSHMNELATLEFGLQQLARQGAAERRELRYYSKSHTDWRNIFQLWRDNGEQVPFVVVKSTWSAASGHFLIVEEVKVKRWPYGDTWGSYHWNGATMTVLAENQRCWHVQLERPCGEGGGRLYCLYVG